ncbi:MAG TPA: SCO family protein [Candidatus Didemnitutus sp.]|nr:SCO family protein [Candidatus Didemnitutus sp.]
MKIPTLFLFACLVGALSAADAASDHACCSALAAGAFTKNSLYQIEAAFTTDAGRPVSLGDFRGGPVVLAMFFSSCNYACPILVADLQGLQEKLPAETRGRTRFVLVSFDSEHDTPRVLTEYRNLHQLDDRWVLLHGDRDAVRELAALLGVKYRQETNGSFSHSNLITILNAEGEITRQRAGLREALDETATALTTMAKSEAHPGTGGSR